MYNFNYLMLSQIFRDFIAVCVCALVILTLYANAVCNVSEIQRKCLLGVKHLQVGSRKICNYREMNSEIFVLKHARSGRIKFDKKPASTYRAPRLKVLILLLDPVG